MIAAHLAAVEKYLLALSQVAANTGHALHKGTPREWFIREFLEDHLSERVGVGTGEIIDAEAKADEPRNQIDAVIYKRDYPKLAFGGGITGYLAESVVATIEVKSTLTSADVRVAVRVAGRIKALKRHLIRSFAAGYHPPSILSYIVAYEGPAKMTTVGDWIDSALAAESVPNPPLPPTLEERIKLPSPALDGIFILGKGFIYYDNHPLGLVTAELRAQKPQLRWIWGESADQNLLMLFLFLTVAISGVSGSWLDPTAYVPQLAAQQIGWSA